VIETVDRGDTLIPERFDGALLSYFLARAEVTAIATYSKANKQLTVSLDPVKAYPDFRHKQVLRYSHGPLSTDEIEIEIDNGLLKKVSSSTSDQTIAAVQAVNALLNQVVATASAIEKSQEKSLLTLKEGQEVPKDCNEDIKVSAVKDVTYNDNPQRNLPEKLATDCIIKLHLRVIPKGSIGIAGYPKGPDDQPSADICDRAVCFRLSGAYTIVASAALFRREGDGSPKMVAEAHAEVIAPQARDVGFVRFERRRFVNNKVALTFTNGVVSGFKATDPSEVVGFLTLPTEILKGVAIAVQF